MGKDAFKLSSCYGYFKVVILGVMTDTMMEGLLQFLAEILINNAIIWASVNQTHIYHKTSEECYGQLFIHVVIFYQTHLLVTDLVIASLVPLLGWYNQCGG